MSEPTNEQQRLDRLHRTAGRKARRGTWRRLARVGRLWSIGLAAFALMILVFWAFLQWYSG